MYKPKYLSFEELNIIRGKVLAGGGATVGEIKKVFKHLDELHEQLDEFDNEDFFGTEGWRHQFGIPGED